MIQIRANTFETNSSSVHTLSIAPKEDFDKWVNGELLFVRGDEEEGYKFWLGDKRVDVDKPFVTEEEARELDPEYPYPPLEPYSTWGYDTYFTTADGGYRDRVFLTSAEYDKIYGYDFMTYSQNFTSPSGDQLVAFGYHGHD